ncbi:FixH family protein [Myxococcota bacterium]|nr:FixH family protein [Myxococcota bacterium]
MTPTPSPQRSEGWFWPWLLVGLLAISSGGSLLMVVIAINDPSFAVEDNYYKKAVEWDKQVDENTQSTRLGWRFDLTLKPHPTRPTLQILSVTLQAQDGSPLQDADVTVRAFHNAQASQPLRLTLKPTGKGRYTSPILAHRPGLWIFRLHAQRGPQRFAAQSRKMLKLPVSKS